MICPLFVLVRATIFELGFLICFIDVFLVILLVTLSGVTIIFGPSPGKHSLRANSLDTLFGSL